MQTWMGGMYTYVGPHTNHDIDHGRCTAESGHHASAGRETDSQEPANKDAHFSAKRVTAASHSHLTRHVSVVNDSNSDVCAASSPTCSCRSPGTIALDPRTLEIGLLLDPLALRQGLQALVIGYPYSCGHS